MILSALQHLSVLAPLLPFLHHALIFHDVPFYIHCYPLICNWGWRHALKLACTPVAVHLSQPLEEEMMRRRRRNHINQPNENIPSDMRKRYGHGKVVWGEGEREAKDWRIKRGSVRRWQLEVMKRGVIRGCGMMFGDYFLIFSSLTFCIFGGGTGPGLFVRDLPETPAEWNLPHTGRGGWQMKCVCVMVNVIRYGGVSVEVLRLYRT